MAEPTVAHLSIGEVLGLLLEEFPDVTISKIRFLESQGLIEPERTPSGYRKFYDADVELLRIILREQREHFLPLRVIKDRIDSGELEPPSDVVAKHPAAGGRGAADPAARSSHPVASRSDAPEQRPAPPPPSPDWHRRHRPPPPPEARRPRAPHAAPAPAAPAPAAQPASAAAAQRRTGLQRSRPAPAPPLRPNARPSRTRRPRRRHPIRRAWATSPPPSSPRSPSS